MSKSEEVNLLDIATGYLEKWSQDNYSDFWIRFYRVYSLSKQQIVENPIVNFDFPEAVGFIAWGSIKFRNLEQKYGSSINGDVSLQVKAIEMDVPEGCMLVLITPCRNGPDNNNNEERWYLDKVVGLLGLLQGKNLIYKQLHEGYLYKNTLYSDAVLNPGLLPVVNLSDFKIKQIEDLARKMEASDKGSLSLSLRWYKESIEAGFGTDSFIKLYVAIDALSNTDGIDTELLMKSYGIKEYSDAYKRFGIKKLNQLRGRVLHNGWIIHPRTELIAYLQAIYYDCLMQKLDLPCEKKAESYLNHPKFNLDELISRETGKFS